MATNVRVLAVSFLSMAGAGDAAAVLLRTFVPTVPLRVMPLGKASYPVPERSLLVGHFTDDVIAAVRSAVEDAGGTVEMDVGEDRVS